MCIRDSRGNGRGMKEESRQVIPGPVVTFFHEVRRIFKPIVRVGVEQLQERLRAAQTFDPSGIKLAADLRDQLRVRQEKREQGLNNGSSLDRLLRLGLRGIGFPFPFSCSCCSGILALLELAASYLRLGFAPVSYTHLDVYKRQAYRPAG